MGWLLGTDVGPAVGWLLGTDVGPAVGLLLGTDVGPVVGWLLGTDVGLDVGPVVGVVGLALTGAWVGAHDCQEIIFSERPMAYELHCGSSHGNPVAVADAVPMFEIVNTSVPRVYTLLGICEAVTLRAYGPK